MTSSAAAREESRFFLCLASKLLGVLETMTAAGAFSTTSKILSASCCFNFSTTRPAGRRYGFSIVDGLPGTGKSSTLW